MIKRGIDLDEEQYFLTAYDQYSRGLNLFSQLLASEVSENYKEKVRDVSEEFIQRAIIMKVYISQIRLLI